MGTPKKSQAIIPVEERARVIDVQRMMNVVTALYQAVFVEGIDYGKIPGVDKPTLFKPGAEKIMRAAQLYPVFTLEKEIEDFDKPLFFYRFRCDLYEKETGIKVGSATGSANSMEEKWGFRWVPEDAVPPNLDKSRLEARNGTITEFAFAVDKAETTGKYGKPAEYWNRFRDEIAAGTAVKGQKKTGTGKMMDTWSIGGIEYKVPNSRVFDLINTILKIAEKRAFISAVVQATGAGMLFTVDVENLVVFNTSAGNSDVVEGEVIEDVQVEEPPAARSLTPKDIAQLKGAFGKQLTEKQMLDGLGVEAWDQVAMTKLEVIQQLSALAAEKSA